MEKKISNPNLDLNIFFYKEQIKKHFPKPVFEKNLNNLELDEGWYFYVPTEINKIKSIKPRISNEPLKGLIQFLSGRNFKGIGDKVATKLVEKYGMKKH